MFRKDDLYEKVCVNSRVVSIAVLVVCGVDEHEHHEVLAIEIMSEKLRSIYLMRFQRKARDIFVKLKEIWLAVCIEIVRQGADGLVDKYEHRFSSAIGYLKERLEDSLAFYAFPHLDSRKISSSNMLEWEILRQISVVVSSPTKILIYFIAETKGTMESLNMGPIEKAKLDGATRLFNEIPTSNVLYAHIDRYERLLSIMDSIK